MCHKRKRYTGDLNDQQWEIVRELLPTNAKGQRRPIEIDLREAMNGMLYIVKTGCQWENLPHEFPHYQRVYYHYRQWCLKGIWEQINRALYYTEQHKEDQYAYPNAAIMASQRVKTSEKGYDAGKR